MLCTCCANIDLNNVACDYRYALLAPDLMAASVKIGCEGCKFFLYLAQLHFKKPLDESNPMPAGTVLQLRRLGANDNRVDLEFVEDGATGDSPPGFTALRLCSSYGMEAPLGANYQRVDQFDEGELVSENLVPDGLFLGRLISEYPDNSECLDIAASWLHRCSRQHENCAEQIDIELPTRLLYFPHDEDQYMELRNTERQRGRYVALSHCWGRGIAFRTTKSTLNARQEGFSISQLPRNFQDAVQVSRTLGFECIWIDALCIIQDDSNDWASESSKMARVYGNASLTISVDLAPHSNSGIFQQRPSISSHQFGPHGEMCLQTGRQGWSAVPQLPLTKRGWTLQERILSPRILHFFEEQIAWECCTTVHLEESHVMQISHDAHFSRHRMKWVAESARNSKETRSTVDGVELENRIFDWHVCIIESSVRQFTKSSDKFPSLSGLASAMQIPEFGKYLAGVWEHGAFLTLAWFATVPRPPKTEYRAPSWSWASTVGYLGFYKGGREARATPAEAEAWSVWKSKYGPELLGHHIIHASIDIKGEVMKGSYIIIRGFCREVYVRDSPASECNGREFMSERTRRPGRKAHMDTKNRDWNYLYDSVSYFSEDLENRNTVEDEAAWRKYMCVQVEREKSGKDMKTFALILEAVEETKATFHRVGLLAFDTFSENASSLEWRAQTLKLI